MLVWLHVQAILLDTRGTKSSCHSSECYVSYSFANNVQHNYELQVFLTLCCEQINLTFLVNIIRVLVTKLRDNNSTEAVQVRSDNANL